MMPLADLATVGPLTYVARPAHLARARAAIEACSLESAMSGAGAQWCQVSVDRLYDEHGDIAPTGKTSGAGAFGLRRRACDVFEAPVGASLLAGRVPRPVL